MKVTISDVAKRAGVSKATVSRVINNKTNVADDVRIRVTHAIKQLGYEPSGIARSLVSKKTGIIGLVIPDITNPFFPTVARGVEDAAHHHGYSVMLCNTDNDPTIETGYIRKLLDHQVEGIILVSTTLDETRREWFQRIQTPLVLCDRYSSLINLDTVSVDNFKAGYDATKHLIAKGHRHILHISTQYNIPSLSNREAGYIEAMQESDLEPNIVYGFLTFESGYQVIDSLEEYQMPTAVFAANDLMALGAMRAFREKGIDVPKDIEIIGCDDILPSRLSTPTLTTILQPAYQMGVRAIELLHERIEGYTGEARKVILDYKFIPRESTGGKR
ncbi:MAG: LacI family DNA-binding transcriptional regulator [Tuberibacillus sp.]